MTSPMRHTHHLRPQYQIPEPDQTAKHHLFIAEEAALPLLQPLFEAIAAPLKKSLVVTDLDISPVTAAAYQLIPRSKTTAYTDAFLLANAKDAAVYIAGTESFLWTIHTLVLKSGVEKNRIHLLEPISGLRRVICTHCFTIIDNVSETLISCSGCQRQLEVQDQFSEVHGAYAASAVRRTNKQESSKPEDLNRDLF